MSSNRVVDKGSCEPVKAEGFIKLYARGRIGLLFPGDMEYAKAAEMCFRQALEISVRLNAKSFVKKMRHNGASEKAICDLLDNCILVDEVHLGPILN